MSIPRPPLSRLDSLLRQKVLHRLADISQGRLIVIESDTRHAFGRDGAGEAPVELYVRDPRFYRQLALAGSVGAAEAYFWGYWDCEYLVELLRLICRDPAVSSQLESRYVRLLGWGRGLARRLRRNTRSVSRRNIAAHYDQGEDFFSLFLDQTLAYSCGFFPDAESTLLQASLAKFGRVCRKLQLNEQDQVMEIGSGWGGFAIFAAQNYGCQVTTTTISERQYEFTMRRIHEEDLAGQVTVLHEDYRNLVGQFDKLVSIEMIEAVGYEYLDAFFRTSSNLLKPNGMMLLQAITIPDQRFDRYRRSEDFIQRYVFPGGCLPSVGAICRSLGRVTDMQLVDLEDITAHYARTLQHWRCRFQDNLDRIRALGFSEKFLRLWHYYFCYCEAGFRERLIGDVQLLLAKPRCRIARRIDEY